MNKRQQFNILYSISMLQSSTIAPKRINCPRHKNQPATHICVQTKCQNNSMLCSHCFSEQFNRHFHYDHEKSIMPFDDAVTKLCNVQKLFKSTLGRSQFMGLLTHIQNGQQTFNQLQQRINSIKNQFEVQTQILTKEFQRLLVIQKQQYFKLLDNYLKNYTKNFEFLKHNVQNVLQFNNQLKFFANKNNFYLKISAEGRKKSDWIVQTKKILQNTQKLSQNSYSNQLSNLLNSAIRIKLDTLPSWKKEQSIIEKSIQIKNIAKKLTSQCVNLPQIKILQEQNHNGNSNTQPSSVSTIGGVKSYYYARSTSL